MNINMLLTVIAVSSALTLSIGAKAAKAIEGAGCVCPENPSSYLQPGTKIRDLKSKSSWGELSERLSNDLGWQLDTGKKALDSSYGVKWEVEPKEVKLVDADGKELYGDYDKLWFKTVPPKADEFAYKLYLIVGKEKSISTDGFFGGKLYLLYFDKNNKITPEITEPSILRYLTQTKPR